MKIGIICHSSCGGSGRIGIESAKELSRRGHMVHFFSRTPPFFPVSREDNILFHGIFGNDKKNEHPGHLKRKWPENELGAMVKEIVSVVEENGLDILHVHYLIPFVLIVERLRQIFGKESPVMVGTLHGTDLRLLKENKETQDLKCFDALTTVSRSHAKLYSRELCPGGGDRGDSQFY